MQRMETAQASCVQPLWPYLTPHDRVTLLFTSTDLRRAALQAAHRFTFDLNTDSIQAVLQPIQKLLAQHILPAAIPVRLRSLSWGDKLAKQLAAWLAQHSSTVAAGVTELDLTGAVTSKQLTALITHLPNLQALALRDNSVLDELPPPSALPKLQLLQLRNPGHRYLNESLRHTLRDSLVPYAPQLTHLHVFPAPPNSVWFDVPSLFTGPAPAAPNLRHFTSAYPLCDTFLSLMRTHAPALQHAGVSTLPKQPLTQPCTLTSLSFGNGAAQRLDLEQLVYIPDSITRVQTVEELCLRIGTLPPEEVNQALSLAVGKGLPQSEWFKYNLRVECCEDTEDVTDLTNQLQIVHRIVQAWGMTPERLWIDDWTPTEDIQAALCLMPPVHLVAYNMFDWRPGINYPNLLSALPARCREIILDPGDDERHILTPDQLRTLLQGAPRDRTESTPLRVHVSIDQIESDRVIHDLIQAVKAVKAEAETSRAYPHVEFTHYPERTLIDLMGDEEDGEEAEAAEGG